MSEESIMPESFMVFVAWPCGCVAECFKDEEIWYPALLCVTHQKELGFRARSIDY